MARGGQESGLELIRTDRLRSCLLQLAGALSDALLELIMAAAQCLLGQDPPRDHLGEQHDSTDTAVGGPPGTYVPVNPLDGAILAHETIFGGLRRHAGQSPLVDLAPALRKLREHLVVTAPDELASGETVVLAPTATDDQVTQFAVEHRDGGRRVFDEHLQCLEGRARTQFPLAHRLAQDLRGGVRLDDVADTANDVQLTVNGDRAQRHISRKFGAIFAAAE